MPSLEGWRIQQAEPAEIPAPPKKKKPFCGRLPCCNSCRHPRQERQLGDWRTLFDFHQVVLSHRWACRPDRLLCPAPRPPSRGLRRPRWLAALSGAAAKRSWAACPPAGDASRRGLIAPELLLRQRTKRFPLRPRRLLVAAVKLAAVGPRRSSVFDNGRHLHRCVPSEAAGREVENGRGDAFAEELAWSGWRRRDRRSPPAGGTDCRCHTVRRGVARGSTSMASDMQGGAGLGTGRSRPACYRRAGRSHHPDANLCWPPASRRLFAVFGPGGRFRARSELVDQLFESWPERVALGERTASSPEALPKEPWRSPKTNAMAEAIQAGFRSSAA